MGFPPSKSGLSHVKSQDLLSYFGIWRFLGASGESVYITIKHLVGVKNKKVILLLNKPIYTGMTVLDLSKLFMYQFNNG